MANAAAGSMRDDVPDALHLNEQLCFPLYAASNLITRLYHPLLAEVGLTYPQYLVLLALWERSPHSVGSLARLLHLDSGTLTPLLKRMETAGLVSRQRDPSDERRVVVELTQAGVDLRERAAEIPHRLAANLTLPVEETLRLRDDLQRLVDDLSAGATANRQQDRT